MAARKPLVVIGNGEKSQLPNGDTLVGNLIPYSASATNEVSTTSTTPSIVSSMTFTNPVVGTYLAIFSAETYALQNGADPNGVFQIYVGGTAQTNTLRSCRSNVSLLLGLIGSITIKSNSNCIIVPVTVNGSQNVDVRFSSVATSVTTYCKQRSFALLRIS